MKRALGMVLSGLLLLAGRAKSAEGGIPVTDELVASKCGTCHKQDAAGNMESISYERTTPEAWQDVLKRMIGAHGLSVTGVEARAIVKYLSTRHGLAPQEAQAVMYDPERRIHEETNIPSDGLKAACAKCHGFARALSWRRSPEDWKTFLESHAKANKVDSAEAIAYLSKAAPLHTPEWDAWSGRPTATKLAGRWEVVASMQGHPKYYGEMQIVATSDDEFDERIVLVSVADASEVLRAGRSAVYGGYAWRGRSKGADPAHGPDDLLNETREVMLVAPDLASIEGRWFWGQYQEFGLDVKLRRETAAPALLVVQPTALKAGTKGNKLRLIGNNFGSLAMAVPNLGPGITVTQMVSTEPHEAVFEVDVAADAAMGRRDVVFGGSSLTSAMAVYDKVDYIKALPDAAMASFGDKTHTRGFQKLEAIGYQRGPDGKIHTADDIDLGEVAADWSVNVFYTPEGSNTDAVATVSQTGVLTPAEKAGNTNFDVWVIAKAKTEKDAEGMPLVGKSYVVVTVPTYSLNGRQYVRDLDRWVDDGPAASAGEGAGK